jgi:hypothetical protein
MDCLGQLNALLNNSTNITIKQVKEAFNPNKIKQLSLSLSQITQLVNSKEFIDCMKQLQKYTTNPSWYDILNVLLIDPNFKDTIVKNYQAVGFSNEFIDNVLLYTSGRPRVNMSKYLECLQVNPRYYSEEYSNINFPRYENYPHIAYVADGLQYNILLPVLRYQEGMSGYCTGPSKKNIEYCGTFYYYEPDSKYILFSPVILVSWNKITACLDLGISFDTVFNLFYKEMKSRITIDNNGNEFLVNPNIIGFNVFGNTLEEQWYNVVKLYQERKADPLKHYPDLYAAEDVFDQLLCETARDKGITVVLLKFMTGETRVVSELVDTRTRKSSFENTLFPPIIGNYI